MIDQNCQRLGFSMNEEKEQSVQVYNAANRQPIVFTDRNHPSSYVWGGGQPPRGRNKKWKTAVAILLIILLILAGALVALLLVYHKKAEQEEALAQANRKYSISLHIDADGWDPSTSSPVPLEVTGKDFNGTSVTKKILYSGEENALSLKRGTYHLEVAASPITQDGALFSLPAELIDFSVKSPSSDASGEDDTHSSKELSEGKENTAVENSVAVQLEPLPAENVTDEMIEHIRAVFDQYGMEKQEIDEYCAKAVDVREAKLEQIAAEKKAKEEAEAAARAAAEAQAAEQAAEAAEQAAREQQARDGYTVAEILAAVNSYYQTEKGAAAPHIATSNSDADRTIKVHVYEDLGDHIATWGWYSIDRFTGRGQDDITRSAIDLTPYLP